MLAEIASSPAGQTDDLGPVDGPDLRLSHSELQVPTPGRASLLPTPSKYFSNLRDPGNVIACSHAGLGLSPLSSGALPKCEGLVMCHSARGRLPSLSRASWLTFLQPPLPCEKPSLPFFLIFLHFSCFRAVLSLGQHLPSQEAGGFGVRSHRWKTRQPFPSLPRS